MSIQTNIYNYFDRNPELKVLFVFDPMICAELTEAEWQDGYKAIFFDGAWFRTKYALEHEWKDLKVILLFDFICPSNLSKFPLAGELAANMEYKAEDYEAFLQQYRLSVEKFGSYVRRHIGELQLSKIDKILHDYYTSDAFSIDVANRGFICAYMGESKLLEWNEIIIRLMMLALPEDKRKETSFYVALCKNQDAKEALHEQLKRVFGFSYDENSLSKMKKIVECFKYNLITSNLVAVASDNYKDYKITNSVQLESMQKLLSTGLNQLPAKRGRFLQVLDVVGADIHVEEIVHSYGIEADFFYVPDSLCIQIVQKALEDISVTDSMLLQDKMRNLLLQQQESSLVPAIEYGIRLIKYYDKRKQITSFVKSTPQEYIKLYQEEYYLLDMYYRQSLEYYFQINVENESFNESLSSAKRDLDADYAYYCQELNREWLRCWSEKGNTYKSLGIVPKQQDIYTQERNPGVKQVFIISDAFRYELAVELLNRELSQEKNIAELHYAVAMLPTETKYTKPALLPHQTLELQGADMVVDGQVLNTVTKRMQHLNKYVNGAVCVDYNDWDQKTREEKREICKNPLVYIFHNTLDKGGHDATARELTRTCQEAIVQLRDLITKLHSTMHVTDVVLTADHGFLYNDIVFADKDKQIVTENVLEQKTRYYLTTSNAPIMNVVKFPLNEVSAMKGDCYVAVPFGTNRFNAPGGGYDFAHGGVSLQEMIIPVLHSKHKRVETKEKVGVTLISTDLKMVSSSLKFQIIQSDVVSMEKTPRHIVCAVYVNDKPVTTLKKLFLNSTDSTPASRISEVELVLNTSVNTSIMELRIYDENDMLNPLIKQNVKNNTLIERDF